MPRKICIVEDNADLRENLTSFMILEGFDILSCRNGLEAIQKLEHYQPDLIITDLWMPVMDGFAFIDALKENTGLKDVPIAVFSAAPLQVNEKAALNEKVAGYISKPVKMDDFLEAVQRFLEK